MAINWFPGHMAKTRRLISENIKMVDIVVELCDARIPGSSRNPVLDELIGGKKRLLVLNKSDMADPAVNTLWLEAYQKAGLPAVLCDSTKGKGLKEVVSAIREIVKEKLERDAQKGMTRAIKVMVVGIPNVGKSSFINKLSGRKAAKVENRPGVTRDKQWIKLENGLDLLDTPGILWPKFEDEEIGLHLAYTGAIKDQILDVEEVACGLLGLLNRLYPEMLAARYGVALDEEETGYEILCAIGKKRGFLVSGGEINTERAANMVLEEFRSVTIGRISLERP